MEERLQRYRRVALSLMLSIIFTFQVANALRDYPGMEPIIWLLVILFVLAIGLFV